MIHEDWLSRRYYGGDLPEAAERALHAAALDWNDEAAAEAHIIRALEVAPGRLEVHLGAYKFYFYRHRLAEALPHARACLEEAGRRLKLPADWRRVEMEHADFAGLDGEARLFLFSLLAWGYLLARLDRVEEGRAALSKVAALDPADKLGARALLRVMEQGGADDDDDDEGDSVQP